MLKYYYEKNFKIYKLAGKLHERIVLYRHNYYTHIKAEHPEISMGKIISILAEPDFVYKISTLNNDFFYEKVIQMTNYRVVITTYKRHVKNVVTAYKVGKDEFDIKRTYCIYNKNTYKSDGSEN